MNQRVKTITVIGVMSAFAFVLYAFEISVGFIIPSAAFLKIDFSDIPVFLTTLSLGPWAGIAVAVIKNILHITITKEPAFSGEIANFFASLAYLLPLCIWRKQLLKKRGLFVLAIVISIISVTLTLSVVNYFITLPLYGIAESLRLPMIFATFIPYNIVRGLLLGIILWIVYPRLQSILDKIGK